MKHLLLLFAIAFSSSATAYEQSWKAPELLKWKSSPENAARLEGGVLYASQPVLLETKKHFSKGGFRQLKLSVTLSAKAPVAPINVIALFQGGKEAGNHLWNQLVRQGIDPGGPVYERFLTVPADATEVGIKIRLGALGSTAGIREVKLEELTPAMLTDRQVTLTANPGKELSAPTAFHFGANFDSTNFPGVYYGTLPASDPASKRAEYLVFLKATKIRSARYPGGTASHWHLPESRRLCQELVKQVVGTDSPMLTGYREFCDTMKEAGLKVVYQVNTSFFADEQGKIHAIDATHYPKRGKFDVSRPRHAEAAAALERNFRNGVFRPGDVDYWELGNEDFAYMSAEQYARVCAALIPVIVRNDPGKPICITDIKGGVEAELKKYPGVWEHVTGFTVHYPYASWPRPFPAYMTADYRAFAHADVNYPKNLDNPGKEASGKKITVSETSVYNLFTYDFFRMQAAFGMALAIGRNWPELMTRPNVDMAVFHDFESLWFGLTRYDVSFSETQREYKHLGGQTPPAKNNPREWFVNPSAANSNTYFSKQYVSSPGMEALGLLSEFAGGRLFATEVKCDFGASGGHLAGTDAAGKAQIFVSNPLESPVLLKISYPGFPAKCLLRQLDSDSFGAALAHEYRRTERQVELKNNEIILPARSVTLLTAE